MTALLHINTQTNVVRRYEPRRVGARPHVTDEVVIIRPQCDTLAEQLNALREGRAQQYITEAPPEAA